jgi:hypothetical protein
MREVLYSCILVALFACCNFWGEKQPSNNCPNLADISYQSDSNYKVQGKLAVDTLNDSFAQLSVGNRWEYEYTIYRSDIESGANTTACGNISFQVIQSGGEIAIIKIGSGPTAPLDTVRVTDDSIINIDTIAMSVPNLIQPPEILYIIPVLIGTRKNIYPCFRFDDSSGYSYGHIIVN